MFTKKKTSIEAMEWFGKMSYISPKRPGKNCVKGNPGKRNLLLSNDRNVTIIQNFILIYKTLPRGQMQNIMLSLE